MTILTIHLLAASAALVCGTTVMMMRRGTLVHRRLGMMWVAAMAITALTSFGIRSLHPGHFSALHGLALVVLFGLARAVWAIRHGNVRAHRMSMTGMYVGLIVAGTLAFALPGRTLNRWVRDTVQTRVTDAGNRYGATVAASAAPAHRTMASNGETRQ
ncbi:hypothetical protein PTE30175_03377 [Pandoraea terrae]|uniref:DUF2306 domain-containing protein n=1 Tax=Pandoraea terrae TaxID=1537710 RepID=A0A5E4WRG5_9BURK|nr:DUF2306 domain-containing protein [Pandoraea terrae]VVE27408.1 hypothetical protein PTE30175_03377 [Pandoraea terrae]